MKLGILFSGGKDSCLALNTARRWHDIECLITLKSINLESYMFHTPNVSMVPLQARAMSIPLVEVETHGEKETELIDLEKAIIMAIDKYDIQGIATGTLASVYQAARIQRIANKLDIWCYNPMWMRTPLSILRELLEEGFKVMITGVFAYPLTADYLGRILDEKLVDDLIEMERRYSINPSGEGGELETTVLDGPGFRNPIEIIDSYVQYKNYSGTMNIINSAESPPSGIAEPSVSARALRGIEMPLHLRKPRFSTGMPTGPDSANIIKCTNIDWLSKYAHLTICKGGPSKILLVDLSRLQEGMHKLEFIDPVRYILNAIHQETEVIHFIDLAGKLEGNDGNRPDSIILCGTALKDNGYQKNLAAFHCLKNFQGEILGICAGMHVLGMLWGGELVKYERIGLHPFHLSSKNRFIHTEDGPDAYHLHNYTVTVPPGFHVLAEDHGLPVAFKHNSRDHYGVLFHPEVRSHEIIERFSTIKNRS